MCNGTGKRFRAQAEHMVIVGLPLDRAQPSRRSAQNQPAHGHPKRGQTHVRHRKLYKDWKELHEFRPASCRKEFNSAIALLGKVNNSAMVAVPRLHK